MWDHIMGCFKKGGASRKICNSINLTDLYKQVPPNQRKQFQLFVKKNEEYKQRVNKYPASLPKIDWAYYEQNVRPEMVNWVKDFQKKYDKLESLFDDRHKLLDLESYFEDLKRETVETKEQIEVYKNQSDERIKLLQEQIDYLKNMKPYEEMTMEEFCLACPEVAPDFINKPTFWPHTPEEQKPGPAEEPVHEDDAGVETKNAGDQKPPTGPPAASPPPPPTAAAPPPPPPATAPPPAAEKSENKSECIELLSAEEKPSNKINAHASEKLGPARKKQDLEKTFEDATAQLSAKGTEMAVKCAELINVVTEKCSNLLKHQLDKVNSKRMEIKKQMTDGKSHKITEKVASPAKASPQQINKTAVFDDKNSLHVREGSKDILNQTIIRGEQLVKPDVKSHHANLDGSQGFNAPREDHEEDICASEDTQERCDESCEEKLEKCNAEQEQEQKCVQNAREMDCYQIEEHKCIRKATEFSNKLEEAKKLQDDPTCLESCKPVYVCTQHEGKGKDNPVSVIQSDETAQGMMKKSTQTERAPMVTESFSPFARLEQPTDMFQNELATAKSNMPQKSTMGRTNEIDKYLTDFNNIIDLKRSAGKAKEAKDTTDSTAEEITDEMKTTGSDSNEDCEPVNSCTNETDQLYRELNNEKEEPRNPENVQKKYDFADVGLDTDVKEDPPTVKSTKKVDDMASSVFLMVTEAANLFKQASNMVEHLKTTKSSRIEIIEAAYLAASSQADRVITEANKAIGAAEKLSKRSRSNTEIDDTKARIMAEKHVELAKMLSKRAVNIKLEIANMMDKLKKPDNFK